LTRHALMRHAWRRFEARCFRFWGTRGATSARTASALFFAWEACSVRSSRAAIAGSPLDVAAQALSILSVGRVTFEAAPKVVAGLDLLLAIALLGFAASRTTTILALLRSFLACAPLVMLHDDLFARFPFRPNALGWGALATFALCGAACLVASRERWLYLQACGSANRVLDETAAQIASRVRRWKRFAQTLVPLLLVVAVASPFAWPRYLTWFHARQEAVALHEKLSGKLLRKSMPPSAILGGRKITTWVYLPPGYGKGKARYPVVYLMHGMPGEVRDCFVKGQVQDAAEQLIKTRQIRPLILVGWDGEGPGGPDDVTNYLDRADYKMESFMVRELVPYVDRTYRTVPDARFRALVGISAGGYAAPNLVFKHPDVWKIAASHTGFFAPEDDAGNMTAILGPRAANRALWNANNPTKTVLQYGAQDDLHVYLDIGQGDDLLPEFRRFAALLKRQEIDSEAHVFPGRHTWEYWSLHFFDSLRFVDASFKKMQRSNHSNP